MVLSLFDLDLLGSPELGELKVLQLEPEVLADHGPAGRHGDVAQHRLAAVAESGRLDGGDVQHAPQLIDDQGRQRLAFNLLGDNQQRTTGLGDLLQERDHLAETADLLLVQQDQRGLQR